MFKKIRARLSAQRLLDEQLYAQVSTEISAGDIREGLWAKATADGQGSESRAKALYIKYRVQSIQDEANVMEEVLAGEQKDQGIKEKEELKIKIKADAEGIKKAKMSKYMESSEDTIDVETSGDFPWVFILFYLIAALLFIIFIVNN